MAAFVRHEISPCVLSPNGEYFAYRTPDGSLKIWETTTGTLKQEYTPSSHLSTTCTCMTWGPVRHGFSSPKKKKRKNAEDNREAVKNLDLIALGTASGNILLYSVLHGDLYSQLDGGHSDTVNDVSWQVESDSIFSCSSDQHIIQWSISSCKIRHKWKGDRNSVYSVCPIDSNNLLSASRTIKWWDVEKKVVIKKFTGHATEVLRLIPVVFPGESSLEGSYFVSIAANDRLINAWQLKKDKDIHAAAAFTVTEEPTNIDVSNLKSRDQPITLSVVMMNGALCVFEHQLNGKCKKPLTPKSTVQIASEGSEDGIEKPKPIPILAAHVFASAKSSVLIAHGNFIKPTFEKLFLGDCKPETWLVRQDPAKTIVTVETDVTKLKQPEKGKVVKYLAPDHMVPAGPIEDGDLSLGKRKRELANSNELPMEERLNALHLEKLPETSSSKGTPRADNMVHLLLQGLQSKDSKLLNSVLYRDDETMILNTVKRLPRESIGPLILELHKRLYCRGRMAQIYLCWVHTVLRIHSNTIIQQKDADSLLGPLEELAEARIQVLDQMSRLQGSLDLIQSQLMAREEARSIDIPSDALLVYHEESSDEETGVVDLLPIHSESEDNWEELSDMEDDEEEDIEMGERHSKTSEDSADSV
ncbi:WD repeat-containing protein 43-like [Limulus polyphemus]|uniref:WD repeat-containing protein 43-like n=1 Tax=Limulus polyphemus TaxID=6850 RepID=A0ABM1BET3_LIMPO|nr:WD repeat-containing protein 43-like [Limulus polyphemus]